MPLLGYDAWRNVGEVMERAKASLKATGFNPTDHVDDAVHMVPIGSGAIRKAQDYRLSRHGAYLCAMNGDPRKPAIAAAQGYFSAMTIRAERLLFSYLAVEPRPWKLEFGPEFYRGVANLKGWAVRPENPSMSGGPQMGEATKFLVYDCIPKAVYEELCRRNPKVKGRRRKAFHHQLLALGGNRGLEKVAARIEMVTAMMAPLPPGTWHRFAADYDRYHRPRTGGTQMDLLDIPGILGMVA